MMLAGKVTFAGAGETTVAVTIIDMLGEEVVVTKRV